MVKRDPPRGHCWAGGAVCGDSDSRLWARDCRRQTNAAGKGSVLIRALESGSRVGMGMRMHHAQQQALLEEMAGQPGVRWFAVTDEQGTIVMHSNSGMMGKQLYSPQEMQQLHPGDEEAWRRIDSADGEPVLEIYRQFQPMFAAGMHRMRHMQQYAATPQAIFIAFDASNIVSAEDREQRNTLIIPLRPGDGLAGKRVVILLVSPISALGPAVAG